MDTKKLRQKILDLAIHGKLVPQDPNDEPASVLLQRIREEKERLIKEGKIKQPKKAKTSSDTPPYGNDAPFEVPEGWGWCKIEDLAYDLLYGTSEKSSSVGQVAVLRMGNINRQGSIDYSNLVYTSNEEDIQKYELIPGDLLFNRTNSSEWVGKTAIYKGEIPAIYAGYLVRVRTVLVNPDYINLVMNSSYHREWCYEVKTDAVNQSNINAQKLSQLQIPLPPIAEQKRIVVEIDRWLALIDKVEQGKEDLSAAVKQTKSKILDLAIHGKLVPQCADDEPASELLRRINPAAVACDKGPYKDIPQSWCWVQLGDIFGAVSAKRVLKSEWQSSGIPFYRAREIVKLNEKGFVDNELYITENHYIELKEKYGIPNANDIMLSAVGTIGKTYVVKETDKFYYKDASVLCLENKNNMNSKYFAFMFETPHLQKQMYENSKGTTVDTITLEKVKSYIVSLPPLAEQRRIVSKIEALFAQLDSIQSSLES